MFIRIKVQIQNGREYQYVYAEKRWREDGKVRSESRCLGRVGKIDWLTSLFGEPGFGGTQQQMDQYPDRETRSTNPVPRDPVPIEKAPAERESPAEKQGESEAGSEAMPTSSETGQLDAADGSSSEGGAQ